MNSRKEFRQRSYILASNKHQLDLILLVYTSNSDWQSKETDCLHHSNRQFFENETIVLCQSLDIEKMP